MLRLLQQEFAEILRRKTSITHWLRKHEAGRGELSKPCLWYSEYHASHFRQVFLRAVQQLAKHNTLRLQSEWKWGIAITGSFLASQLGTHDIDILFQTNYSAKTVEILYNQIVLLPLGLYADEGDDQTREMTLATNPLIMRTRTRNVKHIRLWSR